MKKGMASLVYLFLTGLIFLSCQQNSERSMPQTGIDTTHVEINTNIEKAICVLHPTKGNNVKGIVTFTKENDGIKVVADIEGLKEGKHGFHIHETGDCSADDGSSAGGHFNPEGVMHGARTDSMRHVGDFGNIDADNKGKAHVEFIDRHISFSGAKNIIGRAVIIHAAADDLTSQPSGDAGKRVACGVIGISK
jgi:Cu-Zn family superoxide dismutase